MARPLLFAATLLMLAPLPAAAQRWVPEAGTRAYRYEGVQHVPPQPDNGFRMDYDLVSDGKGGAVAVVRAAWTRAGDTLTPVTVDDTCRAALHAGPGELARVTLFPISKQLAENPGADFMALCAPRALFFPMTDLLNVALIQAAPEFGLAGLAKPGDSHRFDPFKMTLDRLGIVANNQSQAGTTRFAALDGSVASVDWGPDSMALSLIDHTAIPGRELKLEGTAKFGFRIEIDRTTGAMLGAHTTSNQIDVIVNVPDAPPFPMKIISEVAITPRAD